PVTNVSWFAATATARRSGLRLPSEAEWEYAARGGTEGLWSCDFDDAQLRRHANLVDLACLRGRVSHAESDTRWLRTSDGAAAVAPVGSYLANPFGLFDMHGNVTEWCADEYLDYEGAQTTSGASEGKKVLRGGSFARPVLTSRSAARGEAAAAMYARDIGFRVARDLIGARLRSAR
ncbi:MAG: SUMF1/EgtB/PvdO family nonheme iron enzyme, partial [Planctomycetes bacterium]|nr:SUMF1/EgtB/PvdO family nonheme iron enzyme [Planctomycetota bacterium]